MTSDRPVPESLLGDGLAPLWQAVRRTLDRSGPEKRGTVSRPDLDAAGRLALESLLGRTLTKRINLEQLEAALKARRVGEDLSDALSRLGHPPSHRSLQRRTGRARSQEARSALKFAIASWDEPWARDWADEIIKVGLLADLDVGEVERLSTGVRSLLDRLDLTEPSGVSRTELAATLFGSSHALDQGTRLASAASYALRHRVGEPLEGRQLWDTAGILGDRVSAPVLTWSVPATGGSPLDAVISASRAGGLPLHISLQALLRHPVAVPEGTPVLVVENPRLVEAASERSLAGCVVATNGNPTTAVNTLLRQMQQSGASLRYHGDFDAPGIAICRRMHDFGCVPWMMDAGDYSEAVARAETEGIQLDGEPKDCGLTSWDPGLQVVFDRTRLIIHEEFVLDSVLQEFAVAARGS